MKTQWQIHGETSLRLLKGCGRQVEAEELPLGILWALW